MIFLSAPLLVDGPIVAQASSIGLFTDPDGLVTHSDLQAWVRSSLYVFLRADVAVESVAYRLDLDVLGSLILEGVDYGPQGLGTSSVTAEGELVDLGGCSSPDSGGKILVARYRIMPVMVNVGFEPFFLEPHAGIDPDAVAYRPCDGSWIGVDQSLACVASGIYPVSPAPGDVVESGSISPYVFVDTSPILAIQFHELSTDGEQSWSPLVYTNCDYSDALFECDWQVPQLETSHARVRIWLDHPGPPDPGRPELEFTITGTVSTSAASWSTIKGRFSGS